MSQSCVLIVEDDVLVRASLAEYLRECGYTVLEALDADEARQLFMLGAKSIAVVLASAHANPSGEGVFGLAGWIRNGFPDVEVILTGSVTRAAERAVDLCHEGPAQSVPYDHSLLLDRIRRLMAARDRHLR